MKRSAKIKDRVDDKTRLLLKFNYSSSLLCILIGFFCFYVLGIEKIIPHIFIGYGIANLINTAAFKKHGNLTTMALITSAFSVFCTLIITLYSGGIHSPYIFILAIVVLAGYVSTSLFGKIYLIAIVVMVTLIYLTHFFGFLTFENVVPLDSRDFFSYMVVLFAVYILGGVFGKTMLRAHHNLYKSKAEIEGRILEKETLLKEVHHRVKNNLQTVSSLLNLQAKNSHDDHIKSMIKSSQNRVISMAMIHEMLYMRDDLSRIEFGTYVSELTEYLVKSAEGKNKNIVVDIDIPHTELGIDTAIPLGLLINEAVTNSIKYGFTESNDGLIDIVLKKETAKNNYTLRISDNGVGFSEDLDFKNSKSLGLKLIHNLARQLQGSVKRELSAIGTTYMINFEDSENQPQPTS